MGRKPKYALRKVKVLREKSIDPKNIRKGDVYRFDKLHEHDLAVDPNEWFYAEKKPEPASTIDGEIIKGNLQLKGKVLIPPKIGKTLNFNWLKGKKLKNGK